MGCMLSVNGCGNGSQSKADVEALYGACRLQAGAGRYAEAIETCQRALGADSTHVAVRLELATEPCVR